MKYFKGYPEEMKVDGHEITLHDLERTMLSLYWDKTLCDTDKDYLMDSYKEERMRYMDNEFQPTEANRLRLKEVEQLFIDGKQRMEHTHQRIAERELQKSKQGQSAAREVISHLEVWNLENTESVSYTDEECDFWDILFGEERTYWSQWGLMTIHSYISEDELKESYTRKTPKRNYIPKEKEDENSNLLQQMKEAYKLAWQDILTIAQFYLTTELSY